MESTSELPDGRAADHAARASLYAAAAAAFQYPDDEVIADLTDPRAREGLTAAARRHGFESEVQALLEAFGETEPEVLQAMYGTLFDRPDGGEYTVVPYEAAYTAGEEIDKQQRRIATVAGLLEEFDLTVAADHHDRRDHVAVELELMQVVAAQRALACREGDREAVERLRNAGATILGEHLQTFVPAMADRLRSATGSDAYLAAADLAEALVTWDHARHPAVMVEAADQTGRAGVADRTDGAEVSRDG